MRYCAGLGCTTRHECHITTGLHGSVNVHGKSATKTTIKAAFLNHVMSRGNIPNACGQAVGRVVAAWFDSEVELMNERMVYGNAVFSPVSDGTTVPQNHTVCKSQLPLFRPQATLTLRLRENLVGLRDVSYRFELRPCDRQPVVRTISTASTSIGVRPAFSIS